MTIDYVVAIMYSTFSLAGVGDGYGACAGVAAVFSGEE